MRPSFVPPKPIRELRNLTRYRKAQIEERGREAQRLDKVLQDAGVKLSSVATDILGRSGRDMLTALVEGTRDPEILAELAWGRLRAKLPALREAVTGRFDRHHALLVGEILAKLDYLDEAIGRLSAGVDRLIAPFGPELALLDTIPGVDRRTAEALAAEIGVDMTRFGRSARLASWAGLCPGLDESAGKRRSGRLKAWLLGTHHGVGADHLEHYLDEFVFRFNRRFSPMAGFATLLRLGAHLPATPLAEIGSPFLPGTTVRRRGRSAGLTSARFSHPPADEGEREPRGGPRLEQREPLRRRQRFAELPSAAAGPSRTVRAIPTPRSAAASRARRTAALLAELATLADADGYCLDHLRQVAGPNGRWDRSIDVEGLYGRWRRPTSSSRTFGSSPSTQAS